MKLTIFVKKRSLLTLIKRFLCFCLAFLSLGVSASVKGVVKTSDETENSSQSVSIFDPQQLLTEKAEKDDVIVQSLSVLKETAPKETVEEVPPPPFSLSLGQEMELDDLISSFEGNVSVAFCDLESDYQYFYNKEQIYFSASLIKAPYCLYVWTLIEEGKADVNEMLCYEARFCREGTGILKDEEPGGEYSVGTLLEYAIRYSDNIAMEMLASRFTTSGFKSFAKGLGIEHPEFIRTLTGDSLAIGDAVIYMKAVYRFLEAGGENAEKFKKDMLSTRNRMIISRYPVIRKYGWAKEAFHDAAIIDYEHPYILVIMSDRAEGKREDYGMFATISSQIEAYAIRENE